MDTYTLTYSRFGRTHTHILFDETKALMLLHKHKGSKLTVTENVGSVEYASQITHSVIEGRKND